MTTTVNVTESNVVDTNITAGTLNATGITTGNINFTGNLYQNGSLYSPGATWNGFNVTASTSGNNAWGTTFCFSSMGSDGFNWINLSKTRSINGIVYSNLTGKYYAAVQDGGGISNIALLTSNDLLNWTSNTSASSILYTGNTIAYGNNTWVLGSSGISYSLAYSTDGNTWSGGINRSTMTSISSVVFGGNMFIAGGTGPGNTLAYSTNGSSWTAITSIVPEIFIYSVSYGNGTWVVGGQGSNSIAYSSNGTSWTGISQPLGGNAAVFGICYGNGKFVAYGPGSTYNIIYSTNGSSWTGVSSIPNVNIGNITWSTTNNIIWNGTYFILSNNFTYLYSSDGINWKINYTPLGTGGGGGPCFTGQTSSSLTISNQNISFSTGSAQTAYNNTTGTFTAPKSGYYNISMSAYGIGGISGSSLLVGGNGVQSTVLNTANQFIYLSSGNTLQSYISAGKFQSWQVMYT